MIKVGYYGGTFDPFHKAHEYVVNKALSVLNLDMLLILPVEPKHKNKVSMAELNHREEMIKLFITSHPQEDKLRMVDMGNSKEINTCRTIEVIDLLRKKNSEEFELTIIVGSDCVFDLKEWKESERLFKDVNLFSVGRVLNISSTGIRRALYLHGHSEYVQSKTMRYIKENNLYKEQGENNGN